MKRAILPLLLALVLLVSGCGSKPTAPAGPSVPPPAPAVNPTELPAANADGNIQLTTVTTFYNDHFGVEIAVPSGWWIYEFIPENMSLKQGETGSMADFDMYSGTGYESIDLLYYANVEDSTDSAHVDFYYLVEWVEGISDINDFCDDDNDYREGEDNGYTTTLVEQKPFTLGAVSGVVREYEITHDKYNTYTTMVYTIDAGNDYFFSVDTSFYNANNKGLSIIENHIANDIRVTSGGSV